MTIQRAAFVTAHSAQLGLHRHTDRMAHFHHFAGLTDILFIAQRRAIKHHGAEPQAQRPYDCLKMQAVIEIQHHGNIMARGFKPHRFD
ncbi:hypothetical protein D3C78_1764250 [compost metagenome]